MKIDWSKSIGMKFGRLTIVLYKPGSKDHHAILTCLCDCGKETVVASNSLQTGNTTSCGCRKEEIKKNIGDRAATHGATKGKKWSPTYTVWHGMIQRCTNRNNPSWANYGGRGIIVCERWRSFDNFLSDMGERPEGMSIDRTNNNGNYEPGNCKWATKTEQNRNTRHNRLLTGDGKTQPVSVWAEGVGIKASTLRNRVNKMGLSDEEALTRPNRYSAGDCS